MRVIFWFLLALAFALFEVEAEGKYGWSGRSQTWTRNWPHYPKALGWVLGKKPLTGYHIFIFLSAFLVSHLHFGMGLPWSVRGELVTLSVYLAWTPLWDYLWLIFNPHYGVKALGSKKIWWYARSYWVGGLVPAENLIQWGLSLGLAMLAGMGGEQLTLLAGLAGLTMLAAVTLAPIYKRWNLAMHKSGDKPYNPD